MISYSTLFSAKVGRYLTLILLLLVARSNTKAQQANDFLSFNPAGIEGNQIKIIPQGKTVKVLATGGYVDIRVNKALRITEGIIFRTYFKNKSVEKTVDNPFDAAIYLSPGNDFYIDLLDVNSNDLIKRYILQRPHLIPRIEFYNQENHHIYTTNQDGKEGAFKLPPGEKIRLELTQDNGFKFMHIEYVLRNLKTGKTQQGTSKYRIKDLSFEANTYYELRVNYVDQRESTIVVHIRVKPYWYQSIITYVSILVVLAALGILLITKTFKKRINISKKEQRKLEQAAIRLQSLLNPHFTFNALSSIQGLMNTNRIDEANQYLEEFSSLLRQTLATSQQVYTTLDKELEMMRLYIKLEAFRFNFSWEIEIDEELNLSEIEIPTLLLQPLIENAIKHGIGNLGDQGKLIIKCKEGAKKDTFIIVIRDNGTWVEKEHNGYGLSLTAERIQTINKMKKEQSIVLTFNKVEGTEAILTFENWI
ncbi:sensor histidine kinase [Pedobacter frigiditerrae]|uniref:sensor histidine kinase n=1 Tax=Pedobacter frigiditerrae TaxID=2530452 RepID=UPI002931DE4B|nr:histidine kinase [Pedobacter frigiditerrae]